MLSFHNVVTAFMEICQTIWKSLTYFLDIGITIVLHPLSKETLSSVVILKTFLRTSLGLIWNSESPHWIPQRADGRLASLTSHDTW